MTTSPLKSRASDQKADDNCHNRKQYFLINFPDSDQFTSSEPTDRKGCQVSLRNNSPKKKKKKRNNSPILPKVYMIIISLIFPHKGSVTVSGYSGCYNKIPQIEGLKQQKFISSQFWRLESPRSTANQFSSLQVFFLACRYLSDILFL